jgi:hypothetical protein
MKQREASPSAVGATSVRILVFSLVIAISYVALKLFSDLAYLSSIMQVTSVAPRMGDALIFPHGRTPGCFPDPLHEGSEVRGERNGRKRLRSSDSHA